MPPGPGITETKLSASIKGEALQRCECSHSVEPVGIEPGSRPPPAPFPTGTVQQIVMMQLALGPANARSRPGNPLPQNAHFCVTYLTFWPPVLSLFFHHGGHS